MIGIIENIKIDPEFEKLVPPLTQEEFTQLENNCFNFGIRDPLIIWNNLIIDGHNRYKISIEHNLTFSYLDYTNKLNDRVDVIEWMLTNQMGRRNLNPDQLSIIRGKLYNLYKLGHGGDRKSKGQNDTLKDTAGDLANKFKVSDRTIKRDGKFIDENPEAAEKILRGETTKKQITEELRKNKTQEMINTENNKILPVNIKLLEGDLFDKIKEVDDDSIDLLCTDPPYFVLNEDWDEFENKMVFLKFTSDWLQAVIPKVKKTGRIYISFAFDYMFDLYNILLENNFFGFEFYGSIIWVKRNTQVPFNRKGYQLSYEPIVYLYGKEAKILNFTEYGEIQGNVWEIATPQSNYKEGKYHPAQKPVELYRRIISTGSEVNDTILDCFAGSGTTGLVCKMLNRNCILIERDIRYINLIKNRVGE